MTVHFGGRTLALLAVCLGLVALAGCATASSAPPARPSPSPPGVNVAAFDALARQEASAWARTPLASAWRDGLVVLAAGDLFRGPTGKAAFASYYGLPLAFTGTQPSAGPAGVITWPGGARMKVPVLSAAGALGALQDGWGGCAACTVPPKEVTAAVPATLTVPTNRGIATVPAWSFTIRGVSAPVVQSALPSGSYTEPFTGATLQENLRPLGTGFTGVTYAVPSSGGRTLTLTIFGSPCETSWGGLDAVVGDAIVVGGWMHDANQSQPCTAVLVGYKATIHLAAPLGTRVIIDAATGEPIPEALPFTA